MPDDDDEMPDIDEDDIVYFRHDNPDNEKPDLAEDSFYDDLPNINPNDIVYFRNNSSDNSYPNIDPNQITSFPTISSRPRIQRKRINVTPLNLNLNNEEKQTEIEDLINTGRNIIQKEMKNNLTIKKSYKNINYNNENFKRELKEKLEVVAGNILNKYDLKSLDKKALIDFAFELFNHAVINKGIKPDDLGRNKGSRYLSIILIYYALVAFNIYQLGNEFLTGKLIARSIDNYSELGFKTRETMEGHLTVGKFHKFLPKGLKNKIVELPHFKNLIFDNNYKNELIQYLEIAIPELLNFYSISELDIKEIKKHAIEIFNFAIDESMTQNNLYTPYNSNKMALILIFYALLDLGIKSLGITSIGQADIGKALNNVHNKLNFSDSDSMVYLRPKIIYEFLPDRLKNLLDSLPSPKSIIFNQYYKNELKKYLLLIFKDIITKYSKSIINLNSLVNIALTLYNQALENTLTPEDLKKNRMPNQLALILTYFTLIHYDIYRLGGNVISISSIIDSINDFSKLDFNNKESAYNVYPIYLIPFLPEIYKKRVEDLDDAHKIYIEYNQNFKKKLKNKIRFIATKILAIKSLDGIKTSNIISESLKLFDTAIKNGLIPDDLKQHKYARHLSICLIYFSLISLNVISLGRGALSVRDITDAIAEDYDKLGFGSEEAMKFGCGLLNKYIPEDILDKADKIPQTQGIVFNDDYFNDLENNITFIADQVRNQYNLNIDIKDLTSLAIRILEDCIKNGLEPSDLGDNKNASFMSIILIYYALISLKITTLGTGTISVSKIIDSSVDHYDRIGFSSLWFSDRVISGRLYNFLPQNTKEIVDLLPERDQPAGKYESICRQAFNEVFSDIFNMKIKFIPHLSLYKLVENHRIRYINEYIQRAHSDGAVKIFLQKKCIINAFRHKLRRDIDISRDIDELLYIIDDFNSFQIQKIIDRIKDNLMESDSKVIKVQFPIGYIKIFIKNNKIFLLDREVNIPFNYHSENFIWITFEYNGIQHYIFPNYFNKNINQLDSFLKGVINDLPKIYLLYHNGIILFEFPYWICPKMNRPNRIKDFIKKEVNSFFNF